MQFGCHKFRRCASILRDLPHGLDESVLAVAAVQGFGVARSRGVQPMKVLVLKIIALGLMVAFTAPALAGEAPITLAQFPFWRHLRRWVTHASSRLLIYGFARRRVREPGIALLPDVGKQVLRPQTKTQGVVGIPPKPTPTNRPLLGNPIPSCQPHQVAPAASRCARHHHALSGTHLSPPR
jgi:hypothetical protein